MLICVHFPPLLGIKEFKRRHEIQSICMADYGIQDVPPLHHKSQYISSLRMFIIKIKNYY